jgi:uncharacterized protein YndB with AHSA1/START domain
MGADGRITAYEPPRLLEYTWNEREHSRGSIVDSLVRWELTEVGDRVRLTLTHKRLSELEAAFHSAGWHAFVDRLSACVAGSEPPPTMERFAQLKSEYAKHYSVLRDQI